MYEINVDREHGVVEVELSGMMTLAEVSEYISDLREAFVRNTLTNYSLLIDVTRCPVQQQEVIQAMGVHMATMPKARSIALVTGSSLARMQIRRLFTQSYSRIVGAIAEGRAWVIEGLEPAGL